MKKNFALLILTVFILSSCSKSSSNTGNNNSGGGGTLNCNGVSNKFGADVNPIIQSTCATDASCHGSGSGNGPGPLLTYTQIFNARNNIKTAVASGTMPKNGSLTVSQKNSILCWIEAGAQFN
jgi:hypothetical protein